MKKTRGIIGIAGHVDHGKTCLVKALTGTDTDRLPQEKERGMTIEAGFACLDFSDGSYAGIIDVPGHEKFLRNMLAASGGIRVVLLAVDVLEGVMPQTREHLEILSYLGAKGGVVALTKADLAGKEQIEAVRGQVRFLIQGTFLQKAPILPVSAWEGTGMEELKAALFSLLKKTVPDREDGSFSLPLDRIFTLKGHGTVAAGALLGGTLSKGEEVMLYPEERILRIRQIQVHGEERDRAFPGERTAVNLPGISREEILRGDVLAAPGFLKATVLADVWLSLGKSQEKALKNGSRIFFFHGAKRLAARVILFGKKELLPGEASHAQLRMEEKTALRKGERFVIRSCSPAKTIGGGFVTDPCPPRHNCLEKKKRQKSRRESFDVGWTKEEEEMRAFLEKLYKKAALSPPATKKVKEQWKKSPGFSGAFFSLTSQKLLIRTDLEHYIHREAWDEARRLLTVLEQEKQEIRVGDFRDQAGISRKEAIALLEAFDREGITKREGQFRKIL